MKSAIFSVTAKTAALLLLLPCAVMAAPPKSAKPANASRPMVGSPVTPHSINVDVRNLPKAETWSPGMGIREAHRRQYTPLGAKLPHAPANKATARDRRAALPQRTNENARLSLCRGFGGARPLGSALASARRAALPVVATGAVVAADVVFVGELECGDCFVVFGGRFGLFVGAVERLPLQLVLWAEQ